MLKYILLGLGLLVAALILMGTSYFKKGEEVVLDFIKKNPEKSALKLTRNGEQLAAHNANVQMPLASTVKIIIAIEYAEQAAAGTIDPDEQISVAELDQFFVRNTDGGAHPAWTVSVEDKIKDGMISIREIAKGMILYSSNANTEWLMHKLGLDNINARLKKLGVEDHSQIYYIVSALFVGKELYVGRIAEGTSFGRIYSYDESYSRKIIERYDLSQRCR